MIRAMRVFVTGLLLGVIGTLAFVEGHLAFTPTDEGFTITCNAPSIETHRELPSRIAEWTEKTWQK